jgi:hypothetical protein
MTELEEAQELLMTISKQSVSSGDTSLQRAVVILLKAHIQRAKEAKRNADVLGGASGSEDQRPR